MKNHAPSGHWALGIGHLYSRTCNDPTCAELVLNFDFAQLPRSRGKPKYWAWARQWVF
ncbi:hypothetical protein JYQ62_17500 [Nostoc sp. UHCC 0702]|nr:hypothetical protein JYQ62_17500 [Nostoc sp. UHCC 0702]